MRKLILLILLLSSVSLYAQNAKEYIRQGNKQYKQEKFNDAEINYRKSLEADSKSHKAIFNLGDALYKQEQYDKAAKEFASIANRDVNDEITAQAYHNLGNSLLKAGKIEESIDAYKNSLRKAPNDLDTKYNLEYAKRLLKKQQEQKKQNKDQDKDEDKKDQDKDKQNKDQKDKQNNKDQKNKQDNKDQKDKQDNKQEQNKKDGKQNKENEQNQKQQDKQKGNKEQKISKKDAERILQALMQEEKKLQRKLKKKVKGSKGKLEKQW